MIAHYVKFDTIEIQGYTSFSVYFIEIACTL